MLRGMAWLFQDQVLAGLSGPQGGHSQTFSKRGWSVFLGRRSTTALAFFVHKKHGRERLIVHARDVNRHFKRPPAVALASPEALAGLECHGSAILPLTCGTPSIAWPCRKACRTALPCLGERLVRSTLASSMDSSSAAMITCGVAASATGFSWAVYLAQQATTAPVSSWNGRKRAAPRSPGP